MRRSATALPHLAAGLLAVLPLGPGALAQDSDADLLLALTGAPAEAAPAEVTGPEEPPPIVDAADLSESDLAILDAAGDAPPDLPAEGDNTGDADLLAGLSDPAPEGAAGDDAALLDAAGEADATLADGEAADETGVARGRNMRFRLERYTTFFDRRDAWPDLPGDDPVRSWRLRAVAEGMMPITDSLSFRLNTAFSLSGDSTRDFDFDRDARLDLREAYFLWQKDKFALEAGRINIRHGVATGFNPTDFFRRVDAEDRPNLDPTEARLNRLGVAAIRGSYMWSGGSASLTYAPKVTGGDDWLHDEEVTGLQFSSTNPRDRWLLTATHQIAEGISPQIFLFSDDGRLTAGLAASASIGDKWLVYGEVTGGRDYRLTDLAFAPLRESGRLAPQIDAAFPEEGETWINRAALGASYTTEANLTLTGEYHYNGAGFDKDDWDRYFTTAAAMEGDPRAGQLRLVGRSAALAQEPLSKHSLFLRAVQAEAFGKTGLDIGAIAAVSLADGSGSAQFSVSYDIRENAVITGRIGGTFGGRETDFGSRPNDAFATIEAVYHF